ncbi:MAG: hypothetical protein INR72_19525, partial [Williamsia herbipolensis]|nr:hypothetical protein [Williamsia herbipolensis]
YVGSDTNWIGNKKYLRKRIAFFPVKGGSKPASTATATLPADLYLAGPTTDPTALQLRYFDGSTVGESVTDTSTNVDWSTARGVFRVGNSLFWIDTTTDQLQRAPMHGTKIGAVTTVNPYDDPKWENVPTGSGQTYQGVEPDYYSQLSSITGQFYDDGRIYYTLSGDSNVYWRYFEPDDGVIGATAYTVTGLDGSTVEGMTRAGSTVYWADSSDGSLHSIPFSNGTFDTSNEQTIDTGGVDWRGQNLFLAPAPRQVTTTTMTCAHATVRVRRPDRCTVFVQTKGTKAAPATRPTGRARITGSHSGVLSCALRAVKVAGHARCAVTLLPKTGTVGRHRLTGRYLGDAAHDTSHGTHTVRVLPPVKKK